MISHMSSGLESMIKFHGSKREIVLADFIVSLGAAALERGLSFKFDLQGHRLVVTNMGRDFVPAVYEESSPYRLISDSQPEIFGWSMMLRAGSDSEHRVSSYYFDPNVIPTYIIEDKVDIDKDGTVLKFQPELRGAGHMPRSIEREILELLGYEPHEAQLPEMLVEVKGHYWPDADAGMIANPDTVRVMCLASEVPAYVQWFEVTNSDYRNITRSYAREGVEREKGVVLLPCPPTLIVTNLTN